QTRFITEAGEALLTDFMPVTTAEESARLPSPERELLRLVHCTRGELELEIRFEPRPGYGEGLLRLSDAGTLGIFARTRAGLLALRTGAKLSCGPSGASGRVRLRGGDRLELSLSFASEDIATLPGPEGYGRAALERAVRVWRDWAARTKYAGPYR